MNETATFICEKCVINYLYKVCKIFLKWKVYLSDLNKICEKVLFFKKVQQIF